MRNLSKLTILLLATLVTLSFVSAHEELEDYLVNGRIKVTEDRAFQLYLQYRAEGKREDEQFTHFFNNLKRIAEINKQNLSWKAGINKFTFISKEDFMSRYAAGQNCSATVKYHTKTQKALEQELNGPEPPLYIDWRGFDKVTPVKDQGNCGSCWTFATTGAMESHWAIKTGVAPPSLSEQQLVDCAGDFDNNGCNGGLPSHAFEYIKYYGGLNAESVYTYFETELGKCFYRPENSIAFAKGGSVNITYKDEEELYRAVGTIGPVAVAFEVTGDFGLYVGGIYDNPTCGTEPSYVNHAVLAVGYGVQDGIPYWIIKNSWSAEWGESGYFRMVRGKNMCGVSDCAAYPDIFGTGETTEY